MHISLDPEVAVYKTQMSCSPLSLELSRYGLTRVYYLDLQCWSDGKIRIATHAEPSESLHPCPLCHAACEYKLLGEGGTHRELPFFERKSQKVFRFGFPALSRNL
jgi:hypothetical protein